MIIINIKRFVTLMGTRAFESLNSYNMMRARVAQSYI